MVIALVRSLWSPAPPKREAQEMYIALVQQSRKEFFYTDCAVPDTLDGRFDVILLHIFLAIGSIRGRAAPDFASAKSPLRGRREELLRLPSQDLTERELSRLVLEAFFDDMDRSLREMGVGDMGVGKRITKMAKSAFGRLEAYKDAYSDDDRLREALLRNVYRGAEVAPAAVEKLLQYVRGYAAPTRQ